jgi:hypothetical protein
MLESIEPKVYAINGLFGGPIKKNNKKTKFKSKHKKTFT